MTDPDSFANKLQDKRYADFVSTYNFEKYGEKATSLQSHAARCADELRLERRDRGAG